MNAWEAFYGPNVGYALELYERYQQDPNSVDEATRSIFERLGPLPEGEGAVATLARPMTRTGGAASTGQAAPSALSNGNGTVASPSPIPAPSPIRVAAPAAPQTQAITDRDAVLKVVAAARLA